MNGYMAVLPGQAAEQNRMNQRMRWRQKVRTDVRVNWRPSTAVQSEAERRELTNQSGWRGVWVKTA